MNNYEKFRQLHYGQRPVIIANAWNVKSAQLIEQNGFDAIGTSSGAISNSMGYEDGEKIPFSEVFYIIKRIKAVTNIPLTVDMERGYTDDLMNFGTISSAWLILVFPVLTLRMHRVRKFI